ncbi:MAG: hypothetical protein WC260_01915 [Candidatus Pacearchaeota archaeon]
MIREVVKEKTSADHLLYVSLKYTKTCDVILNLIERWRYLIEKSFDALLQDLIDKNKLAGLPNSPKQRIEFIRTNFKKSPSIQNIIPVYIFFKRIPELNKKRESEFRKNVCLKVKLPNEEVSINMEKLTEYSSIIDLFVDEVKKILI